jgi:hypothetical protein
LETTAHGRAAHPGRATPSHRFLRQRRYTAVGTRGAAPTNGYNRFAVKTVGCNLFPGCAARPWAVVSNRFAVKTARKPLRPSDPGL